MNKKWLLTVVLSLFQTQTFYSQLISPTFQLSASFALGVQDIQGSIVANLGLLYQHRYGSIAWSSSAGMDYNIFKYGVKHVAPTFYYENYVFFGDGRENNKSDFTYVSNLYSSNYNLDNNINTFSGFGIGAKRYFLKKDLKHFSNQQALIVGRIKTKKGMVVFRTNNDFKTTLFRGGGTDQGETGRFYLSYSHVEGQQVHTLSLNLNLITPVPDYSRNPDNPVNSEYGMRAVLHGIAPHDNLFHGNFYVGYVYQEGMFNQTVELGVDSQKWGGFLQNILHDSFGLYPRFGWDMKAKNKLYFQTMGTANATF